MVVGINGKTWALTFAAKIKRFVKTSKKDIR